MMVIDWPPYPLHPTQSARGYFLNVFVEPEHRGQGLARALMDLAMEEARRRGLDHMILHATPMGRPLYEALGWTQTSEMGLVFGWVGEVADPAMPHEAIEGRWPRHKTDETPENTCENNWILHQ